MKVHSGESGLDDLLAESDILVGLLPETPQTRGPLDRERIRRLPQGAGIVSAGRGSLIVMPDLIAALDEGHLGAAWLDSSIPSRCGRSPGVAASAHHRHVARRGLCLALTPARAPWSPLSRPMGAASPCPTSTTPIAAPPPTRPSRAPEARTIGGQNTRSWLMNCSNFAGV